MPSLSVVNPELADILLGYKNALDAALMATRLISARSEDRGSSSRQPPASSRRTDALEVWCKLHLQSAVIVHVFAS